MAKEVSKKFIKHKVMEKNMQQNLNLEERECIDFCKKLADFMKKNTDISINVSDGKEIKDSSGLDSDILVKISNDYFAGFHYVHKSPIRFFAGFSVEEIYISVEIPKHKLKNRAYENIKKTQRIADEDDNNIYVMIEEIDSFETTSKEPLSSTRPLIDFREPLKSWKVAERNKLIMFGSKLWALMEIITDDDDEHGWDLDLGDDDSDDDGLDLGNDDSDDDLDLDLGDDDSDDTPSELEEKLMKLKKLFDKGLISESDYNKKKDALLEDL